MTHGWQAADKSGQGFRRLGKIPHGDVDAGGGYLACLPCPRGGIEQAVEMPQSAGAINAYDRNYAMTGVGTMVG